MEMFLKRSYKLIIKFDVCFRNIEVINYFLLKKSINSFSGMVSCTPQLKHKNKKKFIQLCRKVLDAVCTHATSSAASRDSAAKLTTDSYQFWVAH